MAIRIALAGVVAVAAVVAEAVAGAAVTPAPNAGHATEITVNGHLRGQVFDGIGAISGGGGLARFLVDYPPEQRTQILNYMFGPGGADLQMLKLEIGDDSGTSDGSEPSAEHNKGQIDCHSGYEWWLAEQAVERNPRITLIGLQWAAPGWVGSIWSQADVDYVIEWMNCAKSLGLKISYLGGWNEHGYNIIWYENLRKALDDKGYQAVKIIAADAFPSPHYDWASAFDVAKAAAAHPAFKAALNVIGVHDTCQFPTTGYECESTKLARRLGLPIWESEVGKLDSSAAAEMARTINNSYIQADVTGILEWPLVASMPPGLPYGNRGLITALQPQSGYYQVGRIAWAFAQTTQFAQPGWWHVLGASGTLGDSGSYVAYESPNRHDWSLVAQNSGAAPGQIVGPQTITVHLTGGLAASSVAIWSTDLSSSNPATWFVREPSIRASNGTFSYTIKSGYVTSFTSTAGQSHRQYAAEPGAPMQLPYAAAPDASNEAWGLASQEGAYLYEPCLGGASGQCIQQMADQTPLFWRAMDAGTPTPYAVVGSSGWSNYTVSASVLVTTSAASAGLIGRFSNQGTDPKLFDGYQFDLTGSDRWQLVLNSLAGPTALARGAMPGLQRGSWHTLTLSLQGSSISASIDGTSVATTTNSAYPAGMAGIESTWSTVQFNDLTVNQAGPAVPGQRAVQAARPRAPAQTGEAGKRRRPPRHG